MTRPITRAGHIADGRNRFCGADVFDQLAHEVATPADLVIRAFGGRTLDDRDREVLRGIALALASPDARVWPLKLTRVLSSHGNSYAGFHGAQLANDTDKIGPNAANSAARAFATVSDEVGEAIDDPHRVDAAIARYLETTPVVGGFGVPFRDEDERLVELTKLLAGHPIARRRHFRIARAFAETIRRRSDTRPNVVSPLAATVLDFQIPPHRAGLFLAIMMSHTFAAHALEACDHDGPLLREIGFEHVAYRGHPPRRSR